MFSKLSFLIKVYGVISKEFLNNSTLHGMRSLLYKCPHWNGKKIWIFILTIVIIYAHYVILNLIISFLQQPTEIHISPNMIHILNSPFPSIAICSANKISKRKLQKYAEEVFLNQERYRPRLLANNSLEMAEHLLLLGGLFVYPFDEHTVKDSRLNLLHNILTYMYNGSEYPTRQLFRDLSPDCNTMVLRGLLYGKSANMSELFHKHLTSQGVCCMFNYRRNGTFDDSDEIRLRVNRYAAEAKKLKFESSSSLNGLHFVVQSDPEDFSLKQYTNDAYQLYIFPPNDYPVPQSNVIGEILVELNTILDIPIRPVHFLANNDTKQFAPTLRKCYFVEEGKKRLNRTYYSLDECLLICRMESMLKYCGCVSPTLSPSMLNATTCNLLDLPCLTEWKRVWYDWTYFNYVANIEEIERSETEPNQNLQCEHCLPTCNGVGYKIYSSKSPLRPTTNDTYNFGLLKGLSTKKPLAIVKLYFKSLFEQATEEDIVGNWVVMLNRFGGILSLMFGFGLISYIEIIYYYTGKWGVLIYRAYLKNKTEIVAQHDDIHQTSIKDDTNRELQTYAIYWNELKPNRLLRENYLLKKYNVWHPKLHKSNK